MKTENWYSLHIFLHDPEKSEAFLVNRLAPLAQQLKREGRLSGWFFIRYWMGGPHLRFRFRTADVQLLSSIQHKLKTQVQDYCSDTSLTAQDYYANHSFDGEQPAGDSLPWYDEGTVAAIGYEPEYQRYGGEQAIGLSEELFEQSSQLALAIIKATPQGPHARLGLAMPLMVETLTAYTADLGLAEAFFSGYAAFWEAYSSQNAQLAATQRQSQTDPQTLQLVQRSFPPRTHLQNGQLLQIWQHSVSRFIDSLAAKHEQRALMSPFDNQPVAETGLEPALLHLLSSQMHMLNNRLGLTPSFELILSLRIASAIRGLQQQFKEKDSESLVVA